jgi:hypothetical protein
MSTTTFGAHWSGGGGAGAVVPASGARPRPTFRPRTKAATSAAAGWCTRTSRPRTKVASAAAGAFR